MNLLNREIYLKLFVIEMKERESFITEMQELGKPRSAFHNIQCEIQARSVELTKIDLLLKTEI